MPVVESNNNTSNTTSGNGEPKLDPSDPRVKKLVYSMYRDMLTNYSDDATTIINQKDPSQVTIDYGVGPLIHNILRGGNSGSSGGSGDLGNADAPSSTGMVPPPPPPPMATPGSIPAVRLNSEISPRDKGPPMALANAMMKDKKPFTYTPGGIDLSEIRSPRMAKRLQMNAAAEGVTSTPKAAGAQPTKNPPQHLPPAAMAAMQPQMAISVFPQGMPQQLNRAPKPSDFTDGSSGDIRSNGSPTPAPAPVGLGAFLCNQGKIPPPPPPPQQTYQQFMQNQREPEPARSVANPPPPPPQMPQQFMQNQREPEPVRSVATPPPPQQVHQQCIQNQREPEPGRSVASPPPPPPRSPGPARSPVPISMSPIPPASPAPKLVEIHKNGITDDRSSTGSGGNIGTGSIYIPPLSPPTQLPRPQSPRSQTKAQAASQNLGSIYIPPVTQMGGPSGQLFSPGSGYASTPTQSNSNVSTPGSSVSAPSRTPQPPQVLQTPQLNKAPTPWMNSYNKMASKQAESPPYVNPANIMTPWGTLGGPPAPPPSFQGPQGVVRNIPIAIARDEEESSQRFSNTMNATHTGAERASAAQTLGRVIPIQIQRQESLNQQQQHNLQQHQQQQQHQLQQQQAGWPRTIPIQVERSGGQSPSTPGPGSGRRVVGPSGYNNPMGLYSNSNAAEAYQQQAGELMSGIANMSMGSESPRLEPIQSKSMRVIQKAAENVDEPSSTQNKSEPRFHGGHIPSKAFKSLQTTLPSPEAQQHIQPKPPPPSFQQPPGPITHNIHIRMNPQSPTPQQQQQQHLPASEQSVPEPKKYMGGNIPSRSFKMLQAMTGADDADALDSAASGANDNETESLLVEGQENIPENPSFDPLFDCDPYSSYMTWYYWWYYVSCYWAGYDMTGYEYPVGWDPNYPYYPQEFYEIFQNSDQNFQNQNLDCNSDTESNLPGNVPKIVIDSETGDTVEARTDCDSSTEEEFWSCAEDQVIPRETGNCNEGTATTNSECVNGDEEEDEETEGEDGGGEEDQNFVVEEPETPTYSEDSDADAATIVDGSESRRHSQNVLIEEYHSSESETNLVKNPRLSTIEELTERNSSSRASSTLSGKTVTSTDYQDIVGEELEEEEEEEESSSEEEMSSVSVIENKSATESNSKREDGTSTSSDDSDEEDQDINNAVTVRLPLKFSFGKTKSYKDITTVLVGDSEHIREEEGLEEEKVSPGRLEIKEDSDEDFEDDDEPVVSFTISLSRQHSKEDKSDSNNDDEKDEAQEEEDVDYWNEILPKSKDEKLEDSQEFIPIDDFWGTAGLEEDLNSNKNEEPEFTPVEDFWGNSAQEEDFKSKKEETEFTPVEDFWGCSDLDDNDESLSHSLKVKYDTGWDSEFNFWDKSLKTIETRRFSNFEISEDYESDTGMKSDGGGCRGKKEKQRVKRYTHHAQKRHSVPGLPVWNRSSKHGQPVVVKNVEVEEIEAPVDTTKVDTNMDVEEIEPHTKQETTTGPDLSAGWSYWDELENNTKYGTEIADVEDVSVNVEITLPVVQKVTNPQIQNQDLNLEISKEPEDESEEEEDYNIISSNTLSITTSKDQDLSQDQSETKLSSSTTEPTELAPVSDENSDESSKSSGTTIQIGQNTNIAVINNNIDNCNSKEADEFSAAEPTWEEEDQVEPKDVEYENSVQNQESSHFEKPLEIQEIPDSIKLASSETSNSDQNQPHNHSNSCSCLINDRMARAESLLWRIERFLHESLNLGSEDDSGVMTDLSRQISDVDTDADNDLNDAEFLLTAAAAATAKERRTINRTPGPGVTLRETPNVVKRRPQSEILMSSTDFTSKTEVEVEEVKMRNTSAERKALRYQRAKTHSRLFQLLQDECGKDEEDEDDEEEFHDCELLPKTPLSFLHESISSTVTATTMTTTTTSTFINSDPKTPLNEPINVDTTSNTERRSRLLPLPLKNILSSNSDSNSSPSGSSGVLSPTSPVTRDQLLADIINEFHLRHQNDSKNGLVLKQTRFSKFPSKIFKLLQDEFGEEFYQTFDCCGTGTGSDNPGDLLMSSPLLSSISDCYCTHQRDAMNINTTANFFKPLNRDDSKQSTPDYLEVPVRRKRDFRSPKPAKKSQ